MSKITESTIAALNEVDISQVIQETGVDLKKGKTCCPFHDEKTPSFSVKKDENIVTCFGSCNKTWSVLGYVMDKAGISFPEAAERISNNYGIPLVREPTTQAFSDEDKKSYAVFKSITSNNERASKHFSSNLESLENDHSVLQYLNTRLTPSEIQHWGIGYAHDSFDTLKKSMKGQSARSLFDAGLLTESDKKKGHYYDIFRDRIIFPIHDRKGTLIGFGGRTHDGASFKSAAKYINTPETPAYKKSSVLYGLYQCISQEHRPSSYVVCEGYTDVISSHSAGFKNHVASCGTAFGENQLNELNRYSAGHITFVFDGDGAGYNAAVKTAHMLLPQTSAHDNYTFVLLPKGEDVDSYIKTHGADNYELLLDTATPLSSFFLDSVSNSQAQESVEKNASSYAQAITLIGDIEDTTYRNFMKAALFSRYPSITMNNAPSPTAMEPLLNDRFTNLASALSVSSKHALGVFLAQPELLLTMGNKDTRSALVSKASPLSSAERVSLKLVAEIIKVAYSSDRLPTDVVGSQDVLVFIQYLQSHAADLSHTDRFSAVGEFNAEIARRVNHHDELTSADEQSRLLEPSNG